MSETFNKVQVFEQIVKLQDSMESIEKILFKIQCVSDSQGYVEQQEGSPLLLDYMPEVALEKIKAIHDIAMKREQNIQFLLNFYLSIYQKLEDEKKSEP